MDPGTPEGLDVQPVHGGVHADLQEVAQAHGPALHQVKIKQITEIFPIYNNIYMLVARLLATAAFWVRIQTSFKNTKWAV